MDTAELTKNEKSHVERMSEAFASPSMRERFENFARRSISHSHNENKEREGSRQPREISLKDRPEAEREWIKAVAEKDESKDSTKDSAKQSRREDSAEKDAAKSAEQHANATNKEKPTNSEANNSSSEPLSGDRHWQVAFAGKELENHARHVDSRIRIAVDFLEAHPEKDAIVKGFQSLFAGRTAEQHQGFFRDLSVCLAECANPGEVLRHISLQPQDREFLRHVKNWQELRAAVQTIAKAYPAKASQASPKPRAPKPPSEVGGRGSAGDDGTRGAENFGDFSQRQSQRYRRTA